MENIKSLISIKILSYVLVPITVALIIISMFSIIYSVEYKKDIEKENDYFNTENFSNACLLEILAQIRNINKEGSTQMQEESNIVYEVRNIGYDRILNILIEKQDGTAYTNIGKTTKTDTKEKIKQQILNSKYYWIYENNTINTTIKSMSYEDIAYKNQFLAIEESENSIYVAIKEEKLKDIYISKIGYEIAVHTYKIAPALLIISTLVLILDSTYIMISIGHKKNEEGIYTNKLDMLPYEILILVVGILSVIEMGILVTSVEVMRYRSEFINLGISGGIIATILLYITLIIAFVTTIRRIKAKIFWENTICYKIWKFIKLNLNTLFADLNLTIKILSIYSAFILGTIILFFIGMNLPVFFLVLLIFWYFVFKYILEKINKLIIIRKKIKDIYNGNIKQKLNEEEFDKDLKQVAVELNDISGGLSNAVEERLKSERLKTELITNVSHDIKTPLTSIINYVDLLKKENIDNKVVEEYLKVLESKSQRLKKLTEDLIEASKVSSGSIKLQLEKINIKELINQINAEFEEKLRDRGLEIIKTVPDEEIYIKADSKYIFRILENMYTNILKYALENSRIYIDIINSKNNVQIQLKNISKDKLNITEEELMQRFVRGDTSRTTEGSGLGISIAKSLTELQNGKFELYLDGDLFKVVIEFKVIN
ncbi:MAG: HAMP domain-containing histidine kinase [Clostridia bacterium]|nr:HAMP domain-containing histidine kinase [Clostridia bacterium]